MRKFLGFLLIGLGLIFSSFSSFGAKKYHEIKIFDEIGSTSWIYLKNGVAEARSLHVDGIFLHLNTYGGLVDYADSMRTLILNCEIPVYVFIDNNAASAGALISIACDSIYMRSGGNIGAATVVNENGEKMPDKYQSYMRSTIRSTAESHGKIKKVVNGDTVEAWFRDPRIAEAMVDERVVVPGIVDSTRILTFTANEACQNGYCEGIYNSIPQIIGEAFQVEDYELTSYKATAFDKLLGFLMNPVFQGILIMIIIGGIYFEMQTPGIGFALLASIVAGLLYFAPLYMDGLVDVWEALLFLSGIVLLLLEIFVIPGFGVAGIMGIVFIVGGLTLSLLPNDAFDFGGVSSGSFITALATVLLSMLGSFALIVYLTSKIGTDGMFRHLALTKSQDKEDGYVSNDVSLNALAGKIGVCHTDLRPAGKVNVDGEIFDAVAENGFIEKNEEVVIRKYEMGQLYVYKK
ncbi:MAG: nodulation protein NfeD [Paludibacteraceae bacterium]|nr:nodulation protein NfeD [Paludibacteraceae bacterium]